MQKFSSLGIDYPVSKSLFEKTYQLTEKINGIIFFVTMKISLHGIMLPVFFSSFIVYLKSDFDNDSFVLPVPMW